MYHIIKQTRVYTGRPYCGVTSNNVPAEYYNLSDAQQALVEFTKKNPVGWELYNAHTGELVEPDKYAYFL